MNEASYHAQHRWLVAVIEAGDDEIADQARRELARLDLEATRVHGYAPLVQPRPATADKFEGFAGSPGNGG